jgi:ribosomal protein RSM22 (predicted rRNA methylase)
MLVLIPRRSKQCYRVDHSIPKKPTSIVRPKFFSTVSDHKYSFGTAEVPQDVKRKIQNALKNMSSDQLKEEGTALSEMLRKRSVTEGDRNPEVGAVLKGGNIVYSKGKALAYTAHRMPGVYGCTLRVFTEIQQRLGDWTPNSMLDFGSGPGTAILSASAVWPALKRTRHSKSKLISRVLAIEPSSAMLDVAQSHLLHSYTNVQWRRFLMAPSNNNASSTTPPSNNKKAKEEDKDEVFDLVVASYSMSEVVGAGSESWETVLKKLWQYTAPGGVIVIIEAGTPALFELVRQFRTFLLGQTIDDTLSAPSVVAPVR